MPNNPWTTYTELKDVASIMDNIVKRAKQTREILRSQMNENYVDHIEEDTSVNMSPYKDATKNAETRASKSAKSKVEQLFKK